MIPSTIPLGIRETSLGLRSSISALGSLGPLAVGVLDLQAVGVVGLDQAGQDPAVGGGDDHGLVAGGDPPRGVEDGVDQLLAGVLGGDPGKLGADRAPLPADDVALDAGEPLEVGEEGLAALGLALALQGDGRAEAVGVEAARSPAP